VQSAGPAALQWVVILMAHLTRKTGAHEQVYVLRTTERHLHPSPPPPPCPPTPAANTLWVASDIGSEEDCNKAASLTAAKFGPHIHVLVNNAALFVFHSVEHASADDWDRSAAVNIKGHALLTKACLPYMKAAGGGSIVFQGSISAFLAQPNCATYSTMKGAIVQLARNCAYDFAKYNIRVNSICAGTIETPISVEERKAHGWTYEHWESLKIKDVMLGRVGHVREIANSTLFFACDESSYCTATHLMVDGGQTPCTIME
jgi:dihydroanticapsin dehydrogenase